MSQFASLRLPYADPSTPHEMYADCQLVGDQLRLPATRTSQVPGRHVAEHRPTTWQVSDKAAALAGSLHLHLS
ncbi:hypothetical protein [Nocardioides sp. Root151]|uniref:hypothetical protein n=1 Tax=Nocardioides sp. Root151 TaxID=1736475 RepID=UPI0007039ED1|nr:hypothetical protein [Nocardioides sp. Root151]KQZ69819.1 hypothetical protein ASD66_08900 [Nocardioides sp. Root151]